MADVDLTLRADNSQYIQQMRSASEANLEFKAQLVEVEKEQKALQASMKKTTDPEVLRNQVRYKDELKQQAAQLKQNIKATEQQAAAQSRLDRVSAGLGRQFRALGAAIIAAFSIRAISSFIKTSIAAYDKQVQAERRLFFALEGRQDMYNRLTRQASNLQKVTTFGDEQIIGVQAFLAVQGRTEDQINRTIQAAIGLSTVMGVDIQTAAVQLSGTFEGVTGRLSRLDGRIKDLSQEQLKNGAAVDILAEKYKGLAEEAAKAGLGQTKQIKNIIVDIKEAFGGAIMRNISGALGTVKNLFSDIRESVSTTPIDEIRRQQKEFEILSKSIMQPNLSMERRMELIERMRTLEPNFLKDIDAETASIEQLTRAYQDSLQAFRDRIEAQDFQIKMELRQQQIAEKSLEIDDFRARAAYNLKEVTDETNNSERAFMKFVTVVTDAGSNLLSFMPNADNVRVKTGEMQAKLADLEEQELATAKATLALQEQILEMARSGFDPANKEVQRMEQIFLQFMGTAKEFERLKKLWMDAAGATGAAGNAVTEYGKVSMETLEELASGGDDLAKKEIERRKKAAEAAKAHADAVDALIKKLKELDETVRESNAEMLTGTARIIADQELELRAIEEFRAELVELGVAAYGKEYKLTEDQEMLLLSLILNIRRQTNKKLVNYNKEQEQAAEEAVGAIRKASQDRLLAEQAAEEAQFTAIQNRQKAEFNLIEDNADRRKEFELRQQEELIRFQISQSQKLIEIYEKEAAATGEVFDDEIEALKLKIFNLQTELKVIADTGTDGSAEGVIAKILGLDDDGLRQLLDGVAVVEDVLLRLASAYRKQADDRVAAAQDAIQATDNELAEAERAVEAEEELLRQGLANNVEIERQKVSKLKQEREANLQNYKAQQERQSEIDTLVQVSSLITGVAQVLGSAKTWWEVALAILAAGGLVAEYAILKSNVKDEVKLAAGGAGDSSGMIKGKRHSQGGERFLDHVEVEEGEMFGVLSRTASKKYAGLFPEVVDALNAGNTAKAAYLLNGLMPAKLDDDHIDRVQRDQMAVNVSNDYSDLSREMSAVRIEISELRKDARRRREVIEKGDGYIIEKHGNTIRKIRTK